MLRLITGRIGSGKTERVYAEIENLINSGSSSPVLIVPEQYSFETEKNIIRKLGAKKADTVGVYSFTFLSKLLLKQTGISFNGEISDSDRAMIMSLTLDEVNDALVFYKKESFSSGFINDISGMIKEFRQCAITPDDLIKSAKSVNEKSLGDKLSDFSLIQRTYSAIIENSFLDEETSLDLLHDNIDKTDWFSGRTVFIDGFRGFTSQEYRLIEDMLSRCDDVYVTVCTDKVTGLFEKNSVFAHTRRTASKLIRINEKVSREKAQIIPADYNSRAGRKDLDFLEKNLYSLSSASFDGKPENITVCAAESFMDECDFAASKIKELISSGKYRCRDIAVIARDSDTYERRIKASLRKYGVPVYIDKRQPVSSQPLIAFADAALGIAANGFSTENIMRLIKTGLTDIDEEQSSRLENYALMWSVSAGDWLRDFTGHPDGLGKAMLEHHAEELERINSCRRCITQPLYYFRESLKDTDALGAAKALYDLVLKLNVKEHLKLLAAELFENGEYDLAQEQNKVWDIFIGLLNSISSAAGNKKMSAKKFYSLFNLMVSYSSMGAVPTGLDEITAASADRVQLSSPKVVFALGVNDGVFPFVQTNKKILSRQERDTLRSMGLDFSQTAEEDVMEERYIAYNTLCSACEKLYVTYTEKTLTGAQTPPSELVGQIKKLFPCIETVYTSSLQDFDFVRSEESAFEILAKNYNKYNAEDSVLREILKSSADYKGRLKALASAADKKEYHIDDENTAQKLFGRNMYVSASKAESFYKCPFQYFCKYGIKLKPLEKAELDQMQMGRIVHFVLENMLRENEKEKLLKMTDEEIETVVRDLLGLYFEQNMNIQDNDSERFRFLYSNIAGSICYIAKRMIMEFSVSEFVPVDFELPIDNDSEIKPIKIALLNGGVLQVIGCVDRVDMMKTEDVSFIRIIDYKLGGKKFKLGDVFYGLNMQMLIYLFSIWKNGTKKYGETVPAGILYMPGKSSSASLGRHASEEEIIAKQMKAGAMNGLLLDDSRSLYGMDKEKSGAFIPVKFDEKNNCFKGSIIDMSSLVSLYEKLCDLLKNMGNSLHSGKIEAVPVYSNESDSAFKDACTYCDYKSVCGFENNGRRTEIMKMSDEQCIAKLKDGEDDA